MPRVVQLGSILILMTAAGAAVLESGQGAARADFTPTHTARPDWSGLSQFYRAAVEAGIDLRRPKKLDVAKLPPDTALLLVHPVSPLHVQSFTRFLRHGGTLVILDDFGSAAPLLESLQITRTPLLATSLGPRLRGDTNLPVAVPASTHPLTSGVVAVVANRAQALEHPGLAPLLTFGPSGQALAYTGAIGNGHLLAVGDASIVINDMMAFEGNRRFAENLLRYLSGTAGQRVTLVTEHTLLLSPQTRGQRWVTGLRSALGRAGSHTPSHGALLSLAWLLALGTVMFGTFLVVVPGRVGPVFSSNSDSNQTAGLARCDTLLELDTELRTMLGARYSLGTFVSPGDIHSALRACGKSERFRRRIRKLLSGLSQIQAAVDARGPGPISLRQYDTLMIEGADLLDNLSTPQIVPLPSPDVNS